MAPVGVGRADVLILEGSGGIKSGSVAIGMELLSNGMADRMVLVLHQSTDERQLPLFHKKHIQLLTDELEHMGVEKKKVQVIPVPVQSHPITLTEARLVVTKLSESGVRSVILLSEGFHTRRSFLVYRQEGSRVGLHVIPHPWFSGYESDTWWHHAEGIQDFVRESFKLVYYLSFGYVSIKSLLLSELPEATLDSANATQSTVHSAPSL